MQEFDTCLENVAGRILRHRGEAERLEMTTRQGAVVSCRVLLAVLAWVSSSSTALVQQAVPAFEAVSIRRSADPTRPLSLSHSPDGGIAFINTRVGQLIPEAFGLLYAWQVVGLPEWSRSARYDIVAKGDPTVPSPTRAQRDLMMLAVLRERFQMKFHFENREMPAYDLVLARKDGRLGPGLKPISTDCTAIRTAADRPAGIPSLPSQIPPCRFRRIDYRMRGDASVEDIRSMLQGLLLQPVIDQTGLKGYYRVDFSYRFELGPDPIAADSVTPETQEASLFTLVREQLGLKLERGRAPVRTLVIEQFERPTEN